MAGVELAFLVMVMVMVIGVAVTMANGFLKVERHLSLAM